MPRWQGSCLQGARNASLYQTNLQYGSMRWKDASGRRREKRSNSSVTDDLVLRWVRDYAPHTDAVIPAPGAYWGCLDDVDPGDESHPHVTPNLTSHYPKPYPTHVHVG